MEILEVKINVLSRDKVLDRIKSFLQSESFHRVTTVNPEFLVESERNSIFKDNLKKSDLAVADGFGIVLAGKLYGEKIVRFPGAELLHEILKIAEEKKYSVALVIRKDGLSSYEEIEVAIRKIYPNLQITDKDSATIVFCNYGAPEQEFFVEELRNKVRNNVRLGMGVGGSFDYLTRKLKRAPKWMQGIGLEWLWRFFLQPKRIKRIWNAVIVFPILVCIKFSKYKK